VYRHLTVLVISHAQVQRQSNAQQLVYVTLLTLAALASLTSGSLSNMSNPIVRPINVPTALPLAYPLLKLPPKWPWKKQSSISGGPTVMLSMPGILPNLSQPLLREVRKRAFIGCNID
jgi:hypothetical protein